jgi:hypothetical protein
VDPKLELVRLSKLVDAIVAELLDDSADEPKLLYLAVESSLARLAQEMDRMVLLSEKHANEIEVLSNSNEILVGLLSEAWDSLGSRQLELNSVSSGLQKTEALRSAFAGAELEVVRLTQTLNQLDAQIHSIHQSTSWKLTAPVRGVKLSLLVLVRFVKRLARLAAFDIRGVLLRFSRKSAQGNTPAEKLRNDVISHYPEETLVLFNELRTKLNA